MRRRSIRRGRRRMRRRTRRRMRRRMVLVGGAVVLAAGGTAAAIKLSSQDAQRIEEHTGLPPADLEDNDLQEAMNELEIQGQELTAEDQAALAREGSEPKAASKPSAPSVPAEPKETYLDELEKLANLRERGIISDEEFEAKKGQILGI